MSSAASRTYVCVHCHGLVAPPGVPFAWAGDMCICALPKAAPPPAQHFPPCTVCGTPYEKHGTAPTCASHDYTDGGHTVLVVRTSGVAAVDGGRQ